MKRRFATFLLVVGLVGVPLTTGTRALADVTGVSLTVNAPLYSGPCPVDIVFVATVSGDPGTTFGHQFLGAGFPASKKLYGFIPTSGSLSVDDTISVDAAHSGSFDRQVEITTYVRAIGGSMFPKTSEKSKPVTFTVTCATSQGSTTIVGNTPSPKPAS